MGPNPRSEEREPTFDGPNLSLKPIQRPREQIEQQLFDAVLSGHMPPGTQLPGELALAKEFGVGRSTIREALQSLVSRGIVRRMPGRRGTYVADHDFGHLVSSLQQSLNLSLTLGTISFSEITTVREYLEVPAAGLAAVHASDSDIALLEGFIEREKATDVHDASVPHLDVGFHVHVAAAGQNRLLTVLVEAIHTVTDPVTRIKLTPEVGRATVRQHLEIARAIRNRQPEEAQHATRQHLAYLHKVAEGQRKK